jgi:hypothetical protein
MLDCCSFYALACLNTIQFASGAGIHKVELEYDC